MDACGTWGTTSTTSRRTLPTRRSSTSCRTSICRPAGAGGRHRLPRPGARGLALPSGPHAHARPADLADVDAPHQRLRGVRVRSRRLDNSPEANERKALRLVAKTPTLLAMYQRMRTGQEIVPPNPKIPTPQTSWRCCSRGAFPGGRGRARHDFTLYADHTMNASTFTARIIASTLSDMFSAITGAIAALKGRCTAAPTKRR